jgi:hypothetical protein
MNANRRRQQFLKFHELYIDPVAVCNLDCRVCYTDRTPTTRLSTDDMLNFAVKQDAYERQYSSKGLRLVYFCGTGEVFVLRDFPRTLRAFHQRFPTTSLEVHTNGTFPFPNLDFPVKWNLSIDGTRKYHELNRGPDSFRPTVNFLEAALAKGDKVLVRTIVGAWNETNLPRFRRWLRENYGLEPDCSPRLFAPKDRLMPLFKPGYTHEDNLGVASEKASKVYFKELEIRAGVCHQVSIFHNRKMSMREIEDEYIKLMGPCRACHVNQSCWWCIKPSHNCRLQDLLDVESCQDVAQQIADGAFK